MDTVDEKSWSPILFEIKRSDVKVYTVLIFEITVRMDTAKFTNMRVARYRQKILIRFDNL